MFVKFVNVFNQHSVLILRDHNLCQLILAYEFYNLEEWKTVPASLDYAFSFRDISSIMFLCPLKSVLKIKKPS